MQYNLENNINGDAFFLVRYDDLYFDMEISRKHTEEMASGKLKFMGANLGDRKSLAKRVKYYPDNKPIVQLIARFVSNTLCSI